MDDQLDVSRSERALMRKLQAEADAMECYVKRQPPEGCVAWLTITGDELRDCEAVSNKLCCKCRQYHVGDVFKCGTGGRFFILCGDCRFELRHGRRPEKDGPPDVPPPSEPSSDAGPYPFYGSHTVGRFRRYECRSETHVRVLQDLERGQG